MTAGLRTLLASVAGVAALAAAPLATADAVYHSQHIALVPVGTSPLRTGFVENIHPNGPNVYAHEIYVLNGAAPDSTYAVTLHLFAGTSCTTQIAAIRTTTFQTNRAGNGVGQAEFTPSQVTPLRGGTYGIEWTITNGSDIYQTACSTVTLD